MSVAMKYHRLRILLGVACALVTGGAAAQGGVRAVWAIGLPHGYIVMEHQAKVIDVTSEDITLGFVQIAGGSRLIVVTRSQGEYGLHFVRRGALFRSVRIEGVGRTVELGAQGGTVVEHDAPAGRTVVDVSYRFQLAPGTMPGTYAWPLEVVAGLALAEGFVASYPSPAPVTLSERAGADASSTEDSQPRPQRDLQCLENQDRCRLVSEKPLRRLTENADSEWAPSLIELSRMRRGGQGEALAGLLKIPQPCPRKPTRVPGTLRSNGLAGGNGRF